MVEQARRSDFGDYAVKENSLMLNILWYILWYTTYSYVIS